MLLPPPLLSLLVQHDTLLPLLRWREDRFASRQRESERILVRICVEQTSAQERPKVRRLTQCGPVVREMLEATPLMARPMFTKVDTETMM